jgi:hypothetical protein
MAILHTGSKPKAKQKRKPGWQQEQAEHDAWLAKHKANPKLDAQLKKAGQEPLSLKSFNSSPRYTPPARSVLTPPLQVEVIHDPRVLYRDSPEMLERELKAREKKWTAAPLYNKGGDMLVTDEMMKDITSGSTRRR